MRHRTQPGRWVPYGTVRWPGGRNDGLATDGAPDQRPVFPARAVMPPARASTLLLARAVDRVRGRGARKPRPLHRQRRPAPDGAGTYLRGGRASGTSRGSSTATRSSTRPCSSFFGRFAERHPRDRGFLLGVALSSLQPPRRVGVRPQPADARRLSSRASRRERRFSRPTSLGLILATFRPERPASARCGPGQRSAGWRPPSAPSIGGLLVAVSWRWVFLVNVPIGIWRRSVSRAGDASRTSPVTRCRATRPSRGAAGHPRRWPVDLRAG